MTPGLPLLSGTRRAWSQARRVLALRLDNLGDLLMTTPALAAIRESLPPEARLTLLTSPAGAAAAAHLPFVDELLVFDAPWVGGGTPKTAIGLAETALLLRLADGAYDAAVIFTVCTQSALPGALLCRMAGIPLVLAHNRENPYALLSDWIAEPDHVADTMRHEVRRQLDLVAAVGWRTDDERLRFELRQADRARVAAALAAAGVAPRRRYALLHPGASAASRRWPAERFAGVGRALAAAGLAVLVAGDGADEPLCAAVLAGMRGAGRTIGPTTLGELAALIAGAELLVGNNSGPVHLAAAVGTPVLVLYAQTNPQHTPWRVPARVLSHAVACRWCLKSRCPQVHHGCLLGVGVDEAAEAALALASAQRTMKMEQDA